MTSIHFFRRSDLAMAFFFLIIASLGAGSLHAQNRLPISLGIPEPIQKNVVFDRPLPIDPTFPVEVISAKIGHVYAPVGFDDNDFVQLVLTGEFESGCYSVVPSAYVVDHENKRIYFATFAYHYTSPNCPEPAPTSWKDIIEMKTPLKMGLYRIIRVSEKGAEPAELGTINIIHSDSPHRDDFNYAPVDSVIYQPPIPLQGENVRKIIIAGTYENNCTLIDLTKTTMLADIDAKTNSNVLVIRPVTKRDDKNDHCQNIKTAFIESLPIPQNISGGTYLLHVRTKDGHAFNKIQELTAGK